MFTLRLYSCLNAANTVQLFNETKVQKLPYHEVRFQFSFTVSFCQLELIWSNKVFLFEKAVLFGPVLWNKAMVFKCCFVSCSVFRSITLGGRPKGEHYSWRKSFVTSILLFCCLRGTSHKICTSQRCATLSFWIEGITSHSCFSCLICQSAHRKSRIVFCSVLFWHLFWLVIQDENWQKTVAFCLLWLSSNDCLTAGNGPCVCGSEHVRDTCLCRRLTPEQMGGGDISTQRDLKMAT